DNIIQITAAVNFEKFTSGRLSPDGSKLLYVLEEDSLYWSDFPPIEKINNHNGHNITGILPDPSPYFKNLRWSPDGARILFWKDEQIYTFFEGSTNAAFSEPGLYADWSKEGDKIIFQTSDNGGRMYIMNSDASNVESLYTGPWAQVQPRQ
ncbi:MAG: hypothetical protein V3S22_05240, partial [Candidatus Neomarinimicrobiota bacterium]